MFSGLVHQLSIITEIQGASSGTAIGQQPNDPSQQQQQQRWGGDRQGVCRGNGTMEMAGKRSGDAEPSGPADGARAGNWPSQREAP